MNILLSILLTVAACTSSKRTDVLAVATPLAPDAKVEVVGMGQKVPEGAKLLGHVKAGDTGFSVKCNYDDAIAAIQSQARAMGGNLLQITKHQRPNVMSTCHRLYADVYLVK